MTRIIAGAARGHNLKVPKSGTRPTSDRVREAMFSTLESWDAVAGSRVLDLFAGSGALGLEALSRGSSSATLVEKHPPAAAIVKENVKTVLSAVTNARAEVHRASAQTFVEQTPETTKYDLVFIDPPYEFSDESLAKLLAALANNLADDAVIMVERDSRSSEPTWPEGMIPLKQKRYGETTLWWAERA